MNAIGSLLQISFGAPMILAALAALPLLWWLLRVTPPQPRRTFFPPLKLLRGLEDEEQTPAATPWWLLLLRLLAAALLIVALADPLLGRSPKLAGAGPLVIIVDNGWTAAKNWDQRQDLIADLLHSAQGRPVAIIPTAGNAPTGLLNEGEAARIAKELTPHAWTGIRAEAREPLEIEAGAIGARGETLAATRVRFRRGELTARGHIALPMEVRNATTRLSLIGEDCAGAVQLLDKGAPQRSAGIVSETATSEAQPLLSDVYYLERALSTYAEIAKGNIGQLLAKHVSVLLLADVAKIPGDDLALVKEFVSKGGLLIRFAGERTTNGTDDLVPVRLRVGGRYLGRAMAWSA